MFQYNGKRVVVEKVIGMQYLKEWYLQGVCKCSYIAEKGVFRLHKVKVKHVSVKQSYNQRWVQAFTETKRSNKSDQLLYLHFLIFFFASFFFLWFLFLCRLLAPSSTLTNCSSWDWHDKSDITYAKPICEQKLGRANQSINLPACLWSVGGNPLKNPSAAMPQSHCAAPV